MFSAEQILVELRELHADVRQLIAILEERNEARSSVEVKDSPRGADVIAKSYGRTVSEAGESAVAEWLRVRDELRRHADAA